MTASTPVRLSHLLGYCAPGSLVQGAQDELLVPMDTRYWCDENGRPLGRAIERVRRLRAALGIDQALHLPPVAGNDEPGASRGQRLPAVRFPAWTRCEGCGRLYHLPWVRQGIEAPRCTDPDCKDRRPLVQVPWILVHHKGSMDDIPWHWLIHRSRKDHPCNDYDRLYYKQSGGGLRLWCRACDAVVEHPRNALLAEGFFQQIGVMARQPWVRGRVPATELEGDPPQGVEIGDARIFVPQTESGLVIPPESRIRPDPVRAALAAAQQDLRRSLSRPPLFRGKLRSLAGELGCSLVQVEAAWAELDQSAERDADIADIPGGQIDRLEYQALTTPIPDLREDEDFVTRHLSEEWRALGRAMSPRAPARSILAAVGHVVAVDRLRKVLVYQGFRRQMREEPALVPPDLEGEQNWLPAIELYGEGIFLAFAEPMVRAWEQQSGVRVRARAVQRRAVEARLAQPSPRFLLLHTLAHLLIRQLETHSGYPAASLTERLYVQEPMGKDDSPMAGILVYACVPDQAGTLGGLAEAASPARLLPLLEAAFHQAEWCSLDPVCGEHEGQGPHLLNRAACHACALVPDTACEHGNVLLDRGFLRGDKNAPAPFRPLLDFAAASARGGG